MGDQRPGLGGVIKNVAFDTGRMRRRAAAGCAGLGILVVSACRGPDNRVAAA